MDTVLEVIIDYSLSMGPYKTKDQNCFLPDGSTRMSLAKRALIDTIVPALDYSGSIRIIRFHSDKAKGPVVHPIFEGVFVKREVISILTNLRDPEGTGGTPISAALAASIAYLKKDSHLDKKIILVTDGEETDGGILRLRPRISGRLVK